MSCEVYVGNFPSTITSEDLLVLFQDFEGIELLRLVKKAKKCYAFFRCVDQKQAADVTLSMNGIDVCGRNLIVRSSDDRLQVKIQSGTQSSHQIEQQFSELSITPPKGARNARLEPSNPKSHSSTQFDRQDPRSSSKPFNRRMRDRQNSFKKNSQNDFDNHDYSIGVYDERLEHAETEEFSAYGYSEDLELPYKIKSKYDSEASKDELFFVSVVNFPLNTEIRELYELFSDFNPFKIFMICNIPRADKLPTEAIVSFMSKTDATSAILNLDNTVYKRRVLLVTDAADTSLVPELLSLQ